MTVDRHAYEPMYRQVVRLLQAEIEAGDLLPGDVLPSERELADRYQISRDTVRDALQVLRARGLVVSVKGVGSRVAERHKMETYPIPPVADITVRRATPEERRGLRLPEGAMVFVVETPDDVQVYAAEWTRLRSGP